MAIGYDTYGCQLPLKTKKDKQNPVALAIYVRKMEKYLFARVFVPLNENIREDANSRN